MPEQSPQTHRKRLPVSVSAAIYISNEQGHLLLLQQAKPEKGFKWGPPAGGMEEEDFDVIATAEREAREEMGKQVEVTDLVGVYTVQREGSKGIGFAFRGRVIGDCAERRIIDEIITERYFPPSEVEELITQDKLYKPEYNLDGIKDWLAGTSFPLEVIRTFRRII